jgi:2-keto-4-pentenoate hydratase/2-oxohepta-3-ene-1,7-dioic acid hydratase in catechol pathway
VNSAPDSSAGLPRFGHDVYVQLGGVGPVRVGTVYAIGRNFAEHAKEMAAPAEPVAFLKPASAVLAGGGTGQWPDGSLEVHHEVELVLLLGAGGQRLDRVAARAAIAGLAIGVDLTARDLQSAAKKQGQPWARSKGFAASAPVSDFVAAHLFADRWGEIDLDLSIDGATRQHGTCDQMLLDPPALVETLSRWFALLPGDLVFCGTPAGVGPVRAGQRVRAASAALNVAVEVVLPEP